MLPTLGVAGALEQPGEQREDARRVAAGRRRLAGGEPDLALRHRDAGEAVHHQYDVLAGVAEVLGDPGGDEGRAEPLDRGRVGGGDDDDGAGQPLGAEVVLDELAHLAATLADQGDDRHRRVGAAGDHRQQRGLADAAAGHDRDALAAAARHEGVEGADAEADLAGRSGARLSGGGRLVVDRDAGGRRSSGGPPSIGRPRPSTTRPSSSGPTGIESGPPVERTCMPARSPVVDGHRQAHQPVGAAGGDLGEHRSASGRAPRRRRRRRRRRRARAGAGRAAR